MRLVLARLVAALALLAFVTAPAEARSRWLRTETPHFIFYSEVGDRSLIEAARKLEMFDAQVRAMWNLPSDPPANKLEVYLLQSPSRLREVEPKVDQYVVGFYNAEPDLTAAFVTYDSRGGMSGQQVLFHEYVHHFTFQNFTGAYPAWFVEGFAEYLQTTKFEDNRAVVGAYSEARLQDIGSRDWPTIDQFLRHPANLRSDLELRFYAESWVAVHYLYDDPARVTQFVNYVHAIEHGADPVAAIEPAFGMTPTVFEQTLHQYVRHRDIVLKVTAPPEVELQLRITPMPESMNDLLLPLARLKLGVDPADAPALAAQIEQIAASYPGDAFAQRARVRAMLARNGFTEARTVLQPLIAAAPEDAELNYLMGRSYLDEAIARNGPATDVAASARRYFVKAFHSNPNDVATLFDYVQTYGFGDPMPDSAMDVAVRATNLAPQVTSYTISTAYMLMDRGRWDEAIILLRRMAYSPHAGAGAAQAQHLLDAAIHHQMPAPGTDEVQPIAPPLAH